MSKRKYQLPHYDRIPPLIRHAMNIGVLAPNLQESMAKQDPETFLTEPVPQEDLLRMYLSNGGCHIFGAGSELGSFLEQSWSEQYDKLGDRIGLSYKAMWDRYLDLNLVNANVITEREAREFMYAEVVAAHEYDRYGRQAFSIMPILSEMFENTDLGDLTLADLHLPFDCFYVSLEKSEHPMLDGFYVHHRRDTQGDVLAFVGFGFSSDPDHINETWPDGYVVRTEQEGKDRDGYFRYHFEIQLNRTEGDLRDMSKPLIRTPQWEGVPLETIIDTIHTHPDLAHGLDTARGFAGLGMTDGSMSRDAYRGDVANHFPVEQMSRYMVKMAMSLLLYLNSDERSEAVHSERAEVEKADREIARGNKARRGRKRKRGREARERRKHLSTARVTRVGGKQTDAVASRPGFSMDQPRHWRRGHFHRYWTGPVMIDGTRIPYGDWEEKRDLKRVWTLPTLINPEKEIEHVTTRTVVKHEDDAWMDEVIASNPEGGRTQATQTKIERNPKNRRACIEAHGPHCYICGEDGSHLPDEDRVHQKGSSKGLPKGWLHCHHIEELSETGPTETDPEKDMVPLCAGCHSMLHLRKPVYTLEEGFALFRKWEEHRAERRSKRGAK